MLKKTGVATASTVGVAKNDTENTVADEPSIHEGTEKTEPQHHIGNQLDAIMMKIMTSLRSQ